MSYSHRNPISRFKLAKRKIKQSVAPMIQYFTTNIQTKRYSTNSNSNAYPPIVSIHSSHPLLTKKEKDFSKHLGDFEEDHLLDEWQTVEDLTSWNNHSRSLNKEEADQQNKFRDEVETHVERNLGELIKKQIKKKNMVIKSYYQLINQHISPDARPHKPSFPDFSQSPLPQLNKNSIFELSQALSSPTKPSLDKRPMKIDFLSNAPLISNPSTQRKIIPKHVISSKLINTPISPTQNCSYSIQKPPSNFTTESKQNENTFTSPPNKFILNNHLSNSESTSNFHTKTRSNLDFYQTMTDLTPKTNKSLKNLCNAFSSTNISLNHKSTILQHQSSLENEPIMENEGEESTSQKLSKYIHEEIVMELISKQLEKKLKRTKRTQKHLRKYKSQALLKYSNQELMLEELKNQRIVKRKQSKKSSKLTTPKTRSRRTSILHQNNQKSPILLDKSKQRMTLPLNTETNTNSKSNDIEELSPGGRRKRKLQRQNSIIEKLAMKRISSQKIMEQLRTEHQDQVEHDKRKGEIMENRKKAKNDFIENSLKIDQLNSEIYKIKPELKMFRKKQYDHYHTILENGLDTRNEGLSWVIKAIWQIGAEVNLHKMPSFLDESAIQFIFKKADLEMKLLNSKFEFNELIQLNQSKINKSEESFDALIQNRTKKHQAQELIPTLKELQSRVGEAKKFLLMNEKEREYLIQKNLVPENEWTKKQRNLKIEKNRINFLDKQIKNYQAELDHITNTEMNRIHKFYFSNRLERNFDVNILTILNALVGESEAKKQLDIIKCKIKDKLKAHSRNQTYRFKPWNRTQANMKTSINFNSMKS